MDNLVNLVVAEDPGDVSMDEILRVLVPDGVALIASGGRWQRTVKPRPTEIDDWSHYLHDASGNAVAKDSRVGQPRSVQWIAPPLWGRSHEYNPSVNALVTSGGRLFYLHDEGIVGLPDAAVNELLEFEDGSVGLALGDSVSATASAGRPAWVRAAASCARRRPCTFR